MSITLITGSPCAGKSTHALTLTNPHPETLLIDLDRITQSINPGVIGRNHPEHIKTSAREWRRQLINKALRQRRPIVVVDCLLNKPGLAIPRWLYQHRAEIHYVDTDQNTCTQRATEQRAEWTQDLILRWWRDVAPILDRYPDQIRRVSNE